MAKCPKCGKKLTILNVSQFCPACGVNMRFYNFEENFMREAKYAELSNAVIHVKIKRLKAALIGSKLAILRLIAVLFPIAGLLAPAANLSISLPFRSVDTSISGLGIYSMFSDGTLDFIMNMKSSGLIGDPVNALFNAIAGYALIAVFAVLVLLLSVLCFISYKNMQKIICVFDCLGIVVCAVDFMLIRYLVSACGVSPVISASFSFGLAVEALMFALNFAVNMALVIVGIPVEYGEGMLERAEIYKDYKKGRVNLDELPQPVVETEETRKIDEEILKEEENLKKKMQEKEAESE